MNKQEFLNALLTVKPAIIKNGISDAMDYFFFTKSHVVSFNGTISIRCPLKTDFKTFVRGHDLVNLLLGLKAETLETKLKEEKLNIQASYGKKVKVNTNLATIMDDDFISKIKVINKSVKKAEFKPLPNNFSNGIRPCSSVHVIGELDSVLSCALINGNVCMSSDNQRIIKSTLDSKMDKMLVKCSEIEKLLSINPTSYCITDSWIHFKNDNGVIFSIIKVDGDFPDIESLLDFEGQKLILPKDLTDGINIVEIFVDSMSPYINISFKKHECRLSISSSYGDIEYSAKIKKYKGKEVKFSINPEFLKSMIKHTTKMLLSKDNEKLKLETKEYSMLVALYGSE
jgi:hypothetical protein